MGPPTRSVLNKSPRWPKERPASAAMLGVTTMGKRGGAMPFEFSVSDFIPARAQDIYDAWLSSSSHEQITGGQKAQISAQEGAAFTVWNGYTTGRNRKLEPGRGIGQAWATTKFAATAADSKIDACRERASGRARRT